MSQLSYNFDKLIFTYLCFFPTSAIPLVQFFSEILIKSHSEKYLSIEKSRE